MTHRETGPEDIPAEEHGFINLSVSSSVDMILAAAVHGKSTYSEDAGATQNPIPAPVKENPDWPCYRIVFSNSGNRIVAMERAFSVG